MLFLKQWTAKTPANEQVNTHRQRSYSRQALFFKNTYIYIAAALLCSWMSLKGTERHGKTMLVVVLHTYKHAVRHKLTATTDRILIDPLTYEKDHHGGHLNWHTHTHLAVWGLSRTTHFMSLCCCLRRGRIVLKWNEQEIHLSLRSLSSALF